MRYSPDYIAKELRSLADLVELEEDGFEWLKLLKLITRAKETLTDKE